MPGTCNALVPYPCFGVQLRCISCRLDNSKGAHTRLPVALAPPVEIKFDPHVHAEKREYPIVLDSSPLHTSEQTLERISTLVPIRSLHRVPLFSYPRLGLCSCSRPRANGRLLPANEGIEFGSAHACLQYMFHSFPWRVEGVSGEDLRLVWRRALLSLPKLIPSGPLVECPPNQHFLALGNFIV